MDTTDAFAGTKAKGKAEEEPEDIGTVADFIELINTTVGKHFKCCICFRSVCVCLLPRHVLSSVDLPHPRPKNGGSAVE